MKSLKKLTNLHSRGLVKYDGEPRLIIRE